MFDADPLSTRRAVVVQKRVLGKMLLRVLLALWVGAVCAISAPVIASGFADDKDEESRYGSVEERLQIAVKAKTLDQIRHWTDVLVATQDPEAIDLLIRVGLMSDDPQVELEITFRLAQVPRGKVFDYLCKLCSTHPHSQVRSQLTLAFATRKDMDSYKAVLTSLYDKKESVRIAAIEALKTRNDLSCVDHLIRALEYQEEIDRVHSQTAVALRKLLTKFMGPNKKIAAAADWKNYWRINQKAIEKYGPNVKPGEDTDASGRRGGTGVLKEIKLPEFFGEELVSDRICFVIDVSISMAKKDRVPPPGLAGKEDGEDGTDGERGSTEKGRTGVSRRDGKEGTPEGEGTREKLEPHTWPEKMRIRRVQTELSAIIRALPADAKFTVISYSDEVNVWSGGLVPADGGNKSSAVKFIQRFNPKGQTHTDEALEAAFAIPGVRTIYLLSDGAPVRNQQTIDARKIVEWSEQVNRHRKVVINTVGFAATRHEVGTFLHILAVRNGGRYVEIP